MLNKIKGFIRIFKQDEKAQIAAKVFITLLYLNFLEYLLTRYSSDFIYRFAFFVTSAGVLINICDLWNHIRNNSSKKRRD